MDHIYESIIKLLGGITAFALFVSGVFLYFAAAVPEVTNLLMVLSIFLACYVAAQIYLSLSENAAWAIIIPVAIGLPLIQLIIAQRVGASLHNPIIDDPKAWLRVWILFSIVTYIFLFCGFSVAMMSEAILKSNYGKLFAWKIRSRDLAHIPSYCVVAGILCLFLIQTVI